MDRLMGVLCEPPPAVLPFRSAAQRELARFACEGKLLDRKYSRELLEAHVAELCVHSHTITASSLPLPPLPPVRVVDS
jgi:hypothetical protein